MRSSNREEIVETFDALDAALNHALELSYDLLSTPERLALLGRCETLRRRLPALEHPLINQLGEQATDSELGGKPAFALANRLRITRPEASRRIGEAADLGPRRAMTGQPLEPLLGATAAAQRAGTIGAGHVAVIRGFVHRLPGFIDPQTRESAEAHLAELGAQHRPDELSKLAERLNAYLNPDGNYTDEDRARRRGLTIGKQDIDGMTPISGHLSPQARVTLDAVLAKLGAPGMCNPEDPAPCVSGTPSQHAIESDTRNTGQRNHDALHAALRALLARGDLGQHNGLPASIIVSTTLQELQSGRGKALTAGGTWLPMKDVVRIAAHAYHYLSIFQDGKAIGLFHTKRIASPGQRLVLHAKDRGCSFPGCDVPGYLTEIHHVTDYAQCGTTDVNDLTLGCGPHHKLVTSGGWRTRKLKNGDTEWIPPAHLDHGQPRTNRYHHPEKLLRDSDSDGDGDEDDNEP